MGWRRARPDATDGRRTGPRGEDHWWDDADQRFAEQPFLVARDLGRGWQTAAMPNNAERLDPYGNDPDSVLLRSARDARHLTALDEGAAWRLRKEGALLVARIEVFADPDDRAHREAWSAHGTGCLDAVWRERWREREVEAGWVEARWKDAGSVADAASAVGPDPAALADIDWIVVEDHTGSAASGVVTRYQHLTIWCGRALATVILRHDGSLDLDEPSLRAATAAHRRLRQLDA